MTLVPPWLGPRQGRSWCSLLLVSACGTLACASSGSSSSSSGSGGGSSETSGGSGGAGASGGVGGSTTGSGGSGGAGTGGAGASGGVGGGSVGGTSSGGAATTTSISNGGEGGEGLVAPTFCSRISSAETWAFTLAIEFDLATQFDCRTLGISRLYLMEEGSRRSEFLNDLARFNLDLWGCSVGLPDNFGLIYEVGLAEDPGSFTSADIELLIQLYTDKVGSVLDLTTWEVANLASLLESLAGSLDVVESSEFSRNECPVGAAGAGGEPAGP